MPRTSWSSSPVSRSRLPPERGHPHRVEELHRRPERRHLRGWAGSIAATPRPRACPRSVAPSRSGWPRRGPTSPRSAASPRPSRWRAWTKTPPSAPGPPLRYLYEHQTAKSGPSSCRWKTRLPAPCARSNPTIAPTACPARVMARDVEGLSGEVVHVADQHQRQPLALAARWRRARPPAAARPRPAGARAGPAPPPGRTRESAPGSRARTGPRGRRCPRRGCGGAPRRAGRTRPSADAG